MCIFINHILHYRNLFLFCKKNQLNTTAPEPVVRMSNGLLNGLPKGRTQTSDRRTFCETSIGESLPLPPPEGDNQASVVPWRVWLLLCPPLEGVKGRCRFNLIFFKKLACINFIQVSSSIKLAAFFRPAAELISRYSLPNFIKLEKHLFIFVYILATQAYIAL
jgi:hypothetical protein